MVIVLNQVLLGLITSKALEMDELIAARLIDSLIDSFRGSRGRIEDDQPPLESDNQEARAWPIHNILPAVPQGPQSTTTPIHAPLGQREIRLLDIRPNIWHEPLECLLRIVSLDDDNIRYEAISYRWDGDMTNILVNDCNFQVSSSLEHFLRRLRHKNTIRTVWADAICINQSDIQERGAQVNLM